jgi:hypothetical protein
MPDRWNSDRWTKTGVDSSGDPVYSRTNAGIATKDYTEMTKAELQALLEHMALPKTGTKDELVARLQDAE